MLSTLATKKKKKKIPRIQKGAAQASKSKSSLVIVMHMTAYVTTQKMTMQMP